MNENLILKFFNLKKQMMNINYTIYKFEELFKCKNIALIPISFFKIPLLLLCLKKLVRKNYKQLLNNEIY